MCINADACSISPFKPTTPAFPYASILLGEPISLINSGTSISPSLGAKSKIVGLRSSTNPCPCHGFLNTAATETNKTGSLAFFPPSIKVLSTNLVNFLISKFINLLFLY